MRCLTQRREDAKKILDRITGFLFIVNIKVQKAKRQLKIKIKIKPQRTQRGLWPQPKMNISFELFTTLRNFSLIGGCVFRIPGYQQADMIP